MAIEDLPPSPAQPDQPFTPKQLEVMEQIAQAASVHFDCALLCFARENPDKVAEEHIKVISTGSSLRTTGLHYVAGLIVNSKYRGTP